MCYFHHLCCEATEFHPHFLQMTHHPGLYDVQLNFQEKKIKKQKPKKKTNKKDWHVTLGRKVFRCCS